MHAITVSPAEPAPLEHTVQQQVTCAWVVANLAKRRARDRDCIWQSEEPGMGAYESYTTRSRLNPLQLLETTRRQFDSAVILPSHFRAKPPVRVCDPVAPPRTVGFVLWPT
jgi:hypothetical protein